MDDILGSDALECSVCLETFDSTARALPCQHTFCKRCLQDIVDTHKELRCPECRVLVTVPLDQLPPNILLMRILESVRNQPEGRCKPPQGPLKPSISPQNTPKPFISPQNPSINPQTAPSGNITGLSGREGRCKASQQSPHPAQPPGRPGEGTVPPGRPPGGTLPLGRPPGGTVPPGRPGEGIVPPGRPPGGVSEGQRSGSGHQIVPSSLQIVPSTLLRQTSQPCAKALYNYERKEVGDLSFSKGDIIILNKKIDSNWYQGQVNNQTGYFPASYVQIITALPSHIPQCKALYDFKMTNDEEKDCLTFNKGEIITVLRRVDENWAEGKLGARIGIFPLSFVDLNAAAKTLMKFSLNAQQGPSRVAPPTPSSEHHPVTPLIHNPPPSSTSSSSSSLPTSPEERDGGGGGGGEGERERIVPPVPSNQRHSVEISPGEAPTSTPSRVEGPLAKRDGPLAKTESQQQQTSSTLPITSTSTSQPNTTYYVALYSYRGRKGDELELRKGYIYTVSEKCQDGWFKGKCITTERTGVFPGNYVHIAKPQMIEAYLQKRGLKNLPRAPNTYTRAPHSSTEMSRGPSVQERETGGRESLLDTPVPSEGPPSLSPTHSWSAGPLATHPPELPPRSVSSADVTTWNRTGVSSAVSPPPNVALGDGGSGPPVAVVQPNTMRAERKNSKERPGSTGGGGMSLMRKFTYNTGKKKSKSPPPSYSMDNPVFEDNTISSQLPQHHRSGSNPDSTSKGVGGGLGGGTGVSNATSMSTCNPTPGLATSKLPLGQTSAADTSTETPRRKKTPAPLVRERFRCIVAYPANSDYELQLDVGDIIYVHKKRQDGWYKGTHQRTGRTGLFPASFVDSC